MSKAMPPQNHFMNWLKERIRKEEIDIEFAHFESNKYVSQFITATEVKEWENTEPVFISAQTGTGKTTFIEKVLLRIVSDYNDNIHKDYQKKRILIISNRIALNRQVKREIAENVLDIVGDVEGKKRLAYYTPEGIDELTEFGPVSVYPYQRINDSVFKDRNFQFIVCDEFHFFTSDAQFNVNTNTILQNIIRNGHNAVRIYISATPEVAFEAIIREEFDYINSPGEKLILSITKKHKVSKYKNKMIPLKVFYYDMKRKYDYIDIDFVNWTIESLVTHIKDSAMEKSSDKWLIFVASKSDGKDIEAEFNKGLGKNDKKKAVFISSDNKSDGNSKTEFDNIINTQKFDCDYLICTSVLDNGVSIKDETVKDIVTFDIFDRIELLQMIGRIRVAENKQKIRVHIKLPNIGSIYKEKLKCLFATLIPDFSTDVEKEDLNVLNSKVKSLVGKEYRNLFYKKPKIKYYDYNKLSVLQTVSQIMMLKRFYKKYEPMTDNIRAFRRKLYKYCRDEGAEDVWSRNIYDIIESNDERELRYNEMESMKKNANWNQVDNVYSYIYDRNEGFYNYLFLDLILDCYIRKFDSDIIDRLSKDERRELHNRFENTVDTNASHFEHFKTWVSNAMDIVREHGLAFNQADMKKYLEVAEYYHDLGLNENFDTLEQEIYRWFEKPYRAHIEDVSDAIQEKFEQYILDEKFIDSDPEWEYIEKKSLKKYGESKNNDSREKTKEYTSFIEWYKAKYDKKIKDLIKDKPICLGENEYVIDNYPSTDSGRAPHIFFIPLDEKWKPYRDRRGLKYMNPELSPK